MGSNSLDKINETNQVKSETSPFPLRIQANIPSIRLGSGLLQISEHEPITGNEEDIPDYVMHAFPPPISKEQALREAALSPRIFVPVHMRNPFTRGGYDYLPSYEMESDPNLPHLLETGNFSPVKVPYSHLDESEDITVKVKRHAYTIDLNFALA